MPRQPGDSPESKIATYRLLIEYEGTRYSGWQEQRNAPTVAGALLRAIEEAGFPVTELGGAGRTDAGVHALGQCAHLRLGQRVEPAELCRALNRRLPRDVQVLDAVATAPTFHARHDAVARSYLYQISRRRTALAKPWVWWVRDPLDVDALGEAARLVAGRHDFRHFAEVDPGSTGSTLVEVESVEVAEEGALILVRIVASHFLWKMVRRVIGTLAQVGAGNLTLDALANLIEAAPLTDDDPLPAQWTAPPSGLFLERVLYRGDPPLQPMAAVTRVLDAPSFTEGERKPGESAPSGPRPERRTAGRGNRAGRNRPPRPRPGADTGKRPPRPRPEAAGRPVRPRPPGPGSASRGPRPSFSPPPSRPKRGPKRPKGPPRGRRSDR